MKHKLIPIILSGGTGTRLWPVSRESFPKPFAHLVGESSLLEQTLDRADALGGDELMIVCNREHQFLVQDIVAKSSAPTKLLLEPAPRNTAAAISVACIEAAAHVSEDAILLIMPADHRIDSRVDFQRSCQRAIDMAAQGFIVTIGIKPTRPETGYGYIEAGRQLSDQIFAVTKFVEKPQLHLAEKLIRSGHHFWNSGIFCFQAKTMLKALQENAKDILQGAQEAASVAERIKRGETNNTTVAYNNELFGAIRSESIDYAVMEKANDLAMVSADFFWNDVGSWPAVFSESIARDDDGNSTKGDVALVKARNVSIHAESRLVAAVGVDNLIVVETADAVLVLNPAYAQDVKTLTQNLKRDGHECHDTHLTVHRPWGTYTVLEEGPSFKIKRIAVKPGKSLSLQLHHHRSEHWVVVSGTALVQIGEKELEIRQNESCFIPIGERHRLTNAENEDLIIIEVQCGLYLGEDDIVRFADNYGRH